MKRMQWFAAALVMGMGIASLPASAQTESAPPARKPAQTTAAEAIIPPEQQATKAQLAKLFEVMRVRQQMASVRKIVPGMIQEQIAEQRSAILSQLADGKQLTPEQQEAAENILHKYIEKAVNIYTTDEMIDDMSTIYQRHLSGTDVDAAIAFYSSTAGQHLLDQQPMIAQDYMPLAMERVKERSRTLSAEMMKEIAELAQSWKQAPAQPAKK